MLSAYHIAESVTPANETVPYTYSGAAPERGDKFALGHVVI
jgi:hypothetical protein